MSQLQISIEEGYMLIYNFYKLYDWAQNLTIIRGVVEECTMAIKHLLAIWFIQDL